MKELLSIEQKPKHYDEAYKKVAIKFGSNIADVIFSDEGKRIRNEIIAFLKEGKPYYCPNSIKRQEWAAWLEKQGQEPEKVSIWKHWKDGVAGNEGEKVIYLVKKDDTYRLTSCLAFECDYIELSELDGLMFEKQGEQKSADKVKPKDYSSIDPYFGKPIDKIDDDIVVTDKEK